MLSEEFVSSVCGPPLTTNTALAKDVGLYTHALSPVFAVKSTFKKSSTPVNCLAVSDAHIFAAQQEKAFVHVYSRLRGNQEAFVPFPERIRSLTLAGDVLLLGTAEGRLMLWETCTGRLVSTSPRHVQPVSCVVATPFHVLTGSDDSNIHVWSLPGLLELESVAEHEPERSLANHRAAVTSLAVNRSTNPDTSVCVSASKDKTCIIWNYQSGEALRTLLFPSTPLCVAIDPCQRALHISLEDGSLFLVELFAERPLLGPHAAEDASTVVQVASPFGLVPSDAGPASCLGLSYDGTVLLTGHAKGQILRWTVADNETPVELANLNAAVTNLVFLPPLPISRDIRVSSIVKPIQAERKYTFTAQFDSDLGTEQRFKALVNSAGFSHETLQSATAAYYQARAGSSADPDLQRQNEELWQIIDEQRALQRETLQRYVEARSALP